MVDFQWGSGSPDATIDSDTYSTRWEGRVEAPTSGTYTFYPRTDDGVRLWVNGQLIVNDWTNHSPQEFSGNIVLTGGEKVTIVMEYYEDGGAATAELRWAGPGISKDIIAPQYLYLPFTGPENQTINFPAIADKLTSDAPFDITATASSGLAVSLVLYLALPVLVEIRLV